MAAIELFAKQGYDATSTAQIASWAHISEGTIFKYYPSKEQLLLAVVELLTNDLLPQLQAEFLAKVVASDKVALPALVRVIVTDRLAFMKANQQLLRILLQEGLTKPKVRTLVSQGFSQSLKANGEVFTRFLTLVNHRHPDYEPAVIVRLILGPLVTYFSQRFILAPDLAYNEKRDIDLMVTQIVAGLS
nr:TetR/AcrR family transcriptional regulator [Ligilactobacillus agilis]